MARIIKITGVSQVIKNLKRAIDDIEKGVSRGLRRGGLFLQRQSQKVVPIDKSVLKNSARTRNVGGSGFDTDIIVSYNTDYAVYVHENLDAIHKEGKIAKYLEKPARDNRNEILKIIREESKV